MPFEVVRDPDDYTQEEAESLVKQFLGPKGAVWRGGYKSDHDFEHYNPDLFVVGYKEPGRFLFFRSLAKVKLALSEDSWEHAIFNLANYLAAEKGKALTNQRFRADWRKKIATVLSQG